MALSLAIVVTCGCGTRNLAGDQPQGESTTTGAEDGPPALTGTTTSASDTGLDTTETMEPEGPDPADCVNIDPQPGDPCYVELIGPSLPRDSAFALIDRDYDGDLDLFTAGYSRQAPPYWWWMQTAPGVFAEPLQFGDGAQVPTKVLAISASSDPMVPPRVALGELGSDFGPSMLGWLADTGYHPLPLLGPSPSSGVFGDFDGDGVDELLQSQGDDWVLHRWNEDGSVDSTILPGVGSQGNRVYAADMNGDGRDEVVTVIRADGRVLVRWAIEGPSFEPAPPADQWQVLSWLTSTESPSLGDFNGDGVPDLVAADRCASPLVVYPGASDGTFGSRIELDIPAFVDDLRVVDVDGDGGAEVVVRSCDVPAVVVIHRVEPGGVLGSWLGLQLSVTDPPSGPMVVADINGDGYQDFAAIHREAGFAGNPDPHLVILMSHPEVDPLG